MSGLRIRLFGDPVLRQRAAEVTDFGPGLRRLADDMLETMRAAQGAGLAANQIGVLRRLFVREVTEDRDADAGYGAYVNPEVIETSAETQEGDEGCLSFPGLFYPTIRPLRVHLRAQDVSGEPQDVYGEGLRARIFLHELDHLNGILFIDHLARHDYKAAMGRVRAGELEHPVAPYGSAAEGPAA